QAKKSIYMVMYLVSFKESNKKSKVYALVNDLVEARERGVEVKVVLDRTYDCNREDDFDDDTKNEEAFNYLKSKGVCNAPGLSSYQKGRISHIIFFKFTWGHITQC
ncbi:hypothetical protein KKC59_04890, partial [bacterium]|nr:hypothetical protein [bacterium]